jgi:hypothetical protein
MRRTVARAPSPGTYWIGSRMYTTHARWWVAGEFASGRIDGCPKLAGEGHRRLDFQGAIGGPLCIGVALKEGEAREVVGFPLKLVRDFWCQCLLALLKPREKFAVRGKFVVTGFVQLQKILLGFNDRIVDVNDAFVGVVEAKNL